MTMPSQKVLYSAAVESLIWLLWCVRYGHDKAKLESLAIDRDNVSDSALTKLSQKDFESDSTPSLIRPWRRWVDESSTRSQRCFWFGRDKYESESPWFGCGRPFNSAIMKSKLRAFDFATATPHGAAKSKFFWLVRGDLFNQAWGESGTTLFGGVAKARPSQWRRGDTVYSSTRFSQLKGEGNPLPLRGLIEWKERGSSPPSTQFNRVDGEGNSPFFYLVKPSGERWAPLPST